MFLNIKNKLKIQQILFCYAKFKFCIIPVCLNIIPVCVSCAINIVLILFKEYKSSKKYLIKITFTLLSEPNSVELLIKYMHNLL